MYRICRTEYADLSGIGAARFPGRWNRLGQRAVYTSTSVSLAVNELLVHLPKISQPIGYSLMQLLLQPNDDTVARNTLRSAARWYSRIGNKLTAAPGDPIAFFVPSVIVPEYNVVLYPRLEHFEPEFVTIQGVEPFEFDPRFFQSLVTA